MDRGNSWVTVATVGYSFRADTDVRVVFRIHPKNPHIVFTKGATSNGQSTIRRWDTSNTSGLVTSDFNVLGSDKAIGDFYAQNFCVDGYNPSVMYFLSNQGNSGKCLFMSIDAKLDQYQCRLSKHHCLVYRA